MSPFAEGNYYQCPLNQNSKMEQIYPDIVFKQPGINKNSNHKS